MKQPATNAFETWVKWHGGRQAELHGVGAPSVPAGGGAWEGGLARQWTAEELLTGAVEVSVMLAFLQRAEQLGFRPIFYQSSAEGRTVVEGDGTERLTDLIVRPRVGVRCDEEISLVESIFEQVPHRCHLGLMLKALPRIQPIIEVWPTEAERLPQPAQGNVLVTHR
jgi:hypothetical protein